MSRTTTIRAVRETPRDYLPVDLHFPLQGTEIGVDHGYALYAALNRLLEDRAQGRPGWLHDARQVALLTVRGRYRGRGRLALGPQARFGLRLPGALIPLALPLAGRTLRVGSDLFTVGSAAVRPLRPLATLYSHIVTTRNGEDEARFDAEIVRQLDALGIAGRPIRGPRRIITIRGRKVVGHALLVTELSADDSLLLQGAGLGGRRKMGCGVFLPLGR